MMKNSKIYLVLLFLTAFIISMTSLVLKSGATGAGSSLNPKSIIIIYHSGKPPYHHSAPIEVTHVDALSQATTKNVNADYVAHRIKQKLEEMGHKALLKAALDIKGPKEILEYDGIVFGTPTWFSNVAYPVKKVFDEHLIRIYENREGRLNDKVLGGFITVMERGKSGKRCLTALTWSMQQLSERIVNGIEINVSSAPEKIDGTIHRFCKRLIAKMK